MLIKSNSKIRFKVIGVQFLLLITHSPEIKALELLVVIVRVEVDLLFQFMQSLHCLVDLAKPELFITGILNRRILLGVVHEQEDAFVAHLGQLNGLLEEASAPLTVGNLALCFSFNQELLVHFLATHV